jgi:hypothetical protein
VGWGSKNGILGKSSEAGQSTVEFALAVSLTFGFVFFFVHLCMVMAYGNLVHYATFMAARSYLAAGDSVEDQRQRGQDAAVVLLKRSLGQPGIDKYPFIARGVEEGDVPGLRVEPGPQFQPKNSDLSWMDGVRYKFRTRVIPIPMFSNPGKGNLLTLTSESWLGREPSTEECIDDVFKKRGGALFDNGC